MADAEPQVLNADAFPNAETPLPEGMQPLPSAAIIGPLPYNFKKNAVEGFDKYEYSHTALVKDWRNPTVKKTTVYDRPSADHLFELPMGIIGKQPDALLNPPPPTKDEKKATAAAKKAEKDRRAALGDAACAAEDEQQKADKWLAARALNRRQLALRIGRKMLGYGMGLTSIPSSLTEEQLTLINDEITKVLPDDGITLTSDQAVAWLFHAGPLDDAAKKYYNVGSR